MGIVFKNNAKTTLASSLSDSATSATVTDGSVFPSLSSGEFFLVTFDDGTNNEICKCTARSGNTLTIVRAQESTTARAFSSGDSAEGRVTAGVLETIQENIAAKSANQTVFNTTTAGGATTYNIGTNPGVEANAMVFLNGVLQHHDTLSFSGTNLTFDAAPPNGMALEVIIDNLINLQSSNLTVDSFTAADVSGSPQTDFTLSDTPAAETNLIVFVDGVFQDQDAYTISSNTLTITTGVMAGRGVTVYVINPVNIGTPSDSTVTSAKLSGNITMPGSLTVGSNDVAFDSPTFVVDNANSRVGLGTASPSVPVDIVGDVKMSANLTVDTDTLVVDSSNNRVGIGTASPSSPNSIDRFLHIHDADHSSIVLSDDQNTWEIVSNNTFTIRDGTDTRLNISPSGEVGIGTTSPATTLHLDASGGAVLRMQRTSANASNKLELSHDGTDGTISSTNDLLVQASGGHVEVKGNYANTAPANSGTSDTFGLRISQSQGAGILDIGWGDQGSNPHSWLQSRNSGNLGANYAIALNPNGGNLGLGTVSPDGQFHIKGVTNKTLKLDRDFSSGEATALAIARNGVDKWRLFQESDDSQISMYNDQNAAHQFTLHSNGAISTPKQPGARLGLPSNQTIGTSWQLLNFSDTSSTYFMYNIGLTLSSGTITVPTAGRYFIAAQFRTEAAPFSPASQFGIYINNAASGGSYTQVVRLYIDDNAVPEYEHAPPLQGIFDLVAGARIEVRAMAGSANNFVLSSTSNTVNHLSIIKMA